MKRYQEKIPYLPSLAYPHWLSVKYRIEFKALLFVFKALDGLAAGDISELLISTPSPDSQDRWPPAALHFMHPAKNQGGLSIFICWSQTVE